MVIVLIQGEHSSILGMSGALRFHLVSFSDGKRDGPIAGLGRNLPTPDGSVDIDPGSLSDSSSSGPSNALIPSARSKRIADMLEDLEDTCERYLRDRVTFSDTFLR